MPPPPPSKWEEIPPELLGLVLLRLPSLADRVRLRAVCGPWRAGARGQPPLPPPLPWLALRDGSIVDLDGNPIRCAPILPEGVFRYFAVDNLAFVVRNDGGCYLMDPLSGATVPLPNVAPAVRRALDECGYIYVGNIPMEYKRVALSAPLNSAQDPLVAVTILVGNNVVISACKQPDPNAIGISVAQDWTLGDEYLRATDMAFLHGKLYALTEHEGLLVLELDAGRLGEPELSPVFHQCIADNPDHKTFYNHGTESSGRHYLVLRYLVESDGRLLMIRRWISIPRNKVPLGDEDMTCSFEVFQADLTTSPCRWTKVDSLRGQAIFLGTDSSKSLRASKCAGGTREDCIYFIRRVFSFSSSNFRVQCDDPVRDCGVYNIRDGRMTQLLPAAVMAKLRRKQRFLNWFFPSDV